MKRLNNLAGAALAVTAMASSGAFAAPGWGPSGEASYDEHQAQPVSQYTRAQVQSAYLQAAATGALPRTAEVVAESPAELVLAATPMEVAVTAAAPVQDSSAPAAPGPRAGREPRKAHPRAMRKRRPSGAARCGFDPTHSPCLMGTPTA